MASDKPKFVLLAGPSGSGKTTFVNNNPDAVPQNVVTPDVFLDRFAHLPQEEARAKSLELSNAQQAELIRTNQSFVQETLLTSDAKIKLLEDMKARGYETTLIYMCLDNPQDNEDRVRHRIEAGGNFVPPDNVHNDYHLSLQTVPKAILVADNIQIFDNSTFGKRHAHVATIERGVVTELAQTMPSWVEKTFPDGIQAHLDAGNREKNMPQVTKQCKKDLDLER